LAIPSPLIPLPLDKGKGEEMKERLRLSWTFFLIRRRRGRYFRETLHPSLTYTPPSLNKGMGGGKTGY